MLLLAPPTGEAALLEALREEPLAPLGVGIFAGDAMLVGGMAVSGKPGNPVKPGKPGIGGKGNGG